MNDFHSDVNRAKRFIEFVRILKTQKSWPFPNSIWKRIPHVDDCTELKVAIFRELVNTELDKRITLKNALILLQEQVKSDMSILINHQWTNDTTCAFTKLIKDLLKQETQEESFEDFITYIDEHKSETGNDFIKLLRYVACFITK